LNKEALFFFEKKNQKTFPMKAVAMLNRRLLLATLLALPATARAYTVTAADSVSFARYLDGVKQEARREGISQSVLDAALGHIKINGRVIELDRNQPEVQFTWVQYRNSIVSQSRIDGGRAQYAKHRALLARVEAAYGVPGPIVVGLWGLESDYGRDMGRFNVIESVATLAWEGRRGAYFRGQLMDCLRILQTGDIRPEQMLGSWAGAMGQTQFMPDSFLKYAVDFDHKGKRDLWNDFACVFASTANNLAQDGWRPGIPWGMRVTPPGSLDPALIGRTVRQTVTQWNALGVRRDDGGTLGTDEKPASLIQPGAPTDSETYLVYATQFASLRAYNPSDKYALSIGLLADRIGKCNAQAGTYRCA
jgi:membrane-bound lytic murein transglycosylase B